MCVQMQYHYNNIFDNNIGAFKIGLLWGSGSPFRDVRESIFFQDRDGKSDVFNLFRIPLREMFPRAQKRVPAECVCYCNYISILYVRGARCQGYLGHYIYHEKKFIFTKQKLILSTRKPVSK